MLDKPLYISDNDGAGPSPSIWKDCPVLEMLIDPGVGHHFFDTFKEGGLITSPTTAAALVGENYTGFGSAGSTITHDETQAGAIVLTEATDDESNCLCIENATYQISSLLGKFWFEARVKTNTITTAQQAFFVGMMDTTTPTVIIPLTATGALADLNLVGFHKPEANTTALDASYKANGVTAVEVNADIGTLAVDTYIKLGMKFDPSDGAKLTFYVNGVAQTTKKVIPNATGTDFPADVRLRPVIAQHLAATTSVTLTMDWWRVAQEW